MRGAGYDTLQHHPAAAALLCTPGSGGRPCCACSMLQRASAKSVCRVRWRKHGGIAHTRGQTTYATGDMALERARLPQLGNLGCLARVGRAGRAGRAGERQREVEAVGRRRQARAQAVRGAAQPGVRRGPAAHARRAKVRHVRTLAALAPEPRELAVSAAHARPAAAVDRCHDERTPHAWTASMQKRSFCRGIHAPETAPEAPKVTDLTISLSACGMGVRVPQGTAGRRRRRRLRAAAAAGCERPPATRAAAPVRARALEGAKRVGRQVWPSTLAVHGHCVHRGCAIASCACCHSCEVFRASLHAAAPAALPRARGHQHTAGVILEEVQVYGCRLESRCVAQVRLAGQAAPAVETRPHALKRSLDALLRCRTGTRSAPSTRVTHCTLVLHV